MEHNKVKEALEQAGKIFREGFFIFRKDVCKIMKGLKDEDQLNLFWLIADYQLYGKEPEMKNRIDKMDILFFIIKKKLSLDLDREFRDFIAKTVMEAIEDFSAIEDFPIEL